MPWRCVSSPTTTSTWTPSSDVPDWSWSMPLLCKTLSSGANIYWGQLSCLKQFRSDWLNLCEIEMESFKMIDLQNIIWCLFRREQMKMQLVSTGQAVKEKDFFCKSEFDTFEATVRQNFDPRSEANPEVWDCPFNIFCFEFSAFQHIVMFERHYYTLTSLYQLEQSSNHFKLFYALGWSLKTKHIN